MKKEKVVNIGDFEDIYEKAYKKNEEGRKKRLNEWIRGLEKKAIDYSKEEASYMYQQVTESKKYSVSFKKITSRINEEKNTNILENRKF